MIVREVLIALDRQGSPGPVLLGGSGAKGVWGARNLDVAVRPGAGQGFFRRAPKTRRKGVLGMATKRQKVHGIIHVAAGGAAAIGAGLAQLPGSDSAAIVPLQTAMIISIAHVHGVELSKTAAANLLLTFAATVSGRTISQFLVGWVPGIGNAINASTALAITEAIGWAAHEYFGESRANRRGPSADPLTDGPS